MTSSPPIDEILFSEASDVDRVSSSRFQELPESIVTTFSGALVSTCDGIG